MNRVQQARERVENAKLRYENAPWKMGPQYLADLTEAKAALRAAEAFQEAANNG